MDNQPGRPVESLRQKLELFEEHLRELKQTISTEHEVSRGEIERQIAAAEGALERVKDDAMAARARMQAQEQERALATNGQAEAWKRDRHLEQLRSRAEDAEAYAVWSLIVATRAINELALAALKAVAARKDFESGSTE